VVTGPARLVVSHGRVVGAGVRGDRERADAVVVAGAWTGEMARLAGIDLGVDAQRGQILHLMLPGAATSRLPVVEDVGQSTNVLASSPGASRVARARGRSRRRTSPRPVPGRRPPARPAGSTRCRCPPRDPKPHGWTPRDQSPPPPEEFILWSQRQPVAFLPPTWLAESTALLYMTSASYILSM
jgi:hypothetical protein